MGKNDNRQCKVCREEYESVVHVLWQCSVYDTIDNLLRRGEVLKSLVHSIILRDQALFLGCEIWDRYDFKALLKLLRCCIINLDTKKIFYNVVTSDCSSSCRSTGKLTSSACVGGCVVNGISATAAT